MKQPTDVAKETSRRLAQRWHEHEAGEESALWPNTISLGEPTKSELEADFDVARRWALSWRQWATDNKLELTWRNRNVNGTTQSLPTHVTIPDIDTAAKLAGTAWTENLTVARQRWLRLKREFPRTASPKMLRAVATLSDADFDLLCAAATWFETHDSSGLTPRQVPVEGLHGKWLNTNIELVRQLSLRENLGLSKRPTTIHFSYLDTDHLLAGGRRHDSATIGDAESLAYVPTVLIISENKDTAIFFPDVVKGIAIQGSGFEGVSIFARLPWVQECPAVFYWGDIDASGFEILNRLRSNGVRADSILMDRSTFELYQRFGATTDAHGNSLVCSPRKTLAYLTGPESAMYHDLTDPQWQNVRRIEQERIPLQTARTALVSLLAREQNALQL
ncbi:MAG: hypothetical protein JWN70_3732 [Planctomycetaceae bacterium]|nr:hypothetical protein [Planctomycetaceae bacterium]